MKTQTIFIILIMANIGLFAQGLIMTPDTRMTIKSGTQLNLSDDGNLVLQSDATGDASLLEQGTITFGGTGTALIERYLTDNMWHQVTPSTTGVTANDFYWSDAPKSWLLSHDESQLDDDSWTYITSTNTALNVGQGYMVWLDDNTKSPATASMEGNTQSTDLSPTLAFTDASHGWNLIGNPFPCAIDYDEGSWGSNTTGFVYVWDNAYNSGDYRVSGADLTGNIIPIGQGFFVDATSSASFDIPAAARVHSSQSFYKSINSDSDQYVRIQLDGNGYGNTVFVGFPENGTDGMDYKGDARKLYSSSDTPQLFAVENNTELCVNANKPLTEGESKTVPLHLVQVVDEEYSLTITDLDQLENMSITLEDVKTGVTQDLRKLPVYTFTASSNDIPERFLLHFAWSPDGIGEDLEQASNIQIYSYGKEVYIRSTEEAVNQDGVVIIYDLMGRELLQQSLERGELVRIPLNISNNYAVVMVVKEDSIRIEKIFIK